MDWIDSIEDKAQTAEAVGKAYTVLRPLPAKPTERVSKLLTSSASTPDAVPVFDRNAQGKLVITDEDLTAFPALSKQDSLSSRRIRAEAYATAAKVLHDNYQVFCSEFDVDNFEVLWNKFITRHCRSGHHSSSSGSPSGPAVVPAALLSSRGDSADSCATYSRLKGFLQKHEAYVALLEQADFIGGVAGVMSSLVEQLHGPSQYAAEDIEALHAWYTDQTCVKEPAAKPLAT
eukprot:CAMPEP_0202911348 /NCGR_PEP_ID=MMETSP1392-20130828/54728_1 /ASSEMBLY_ACC=CAM_ASM_000868 /TAXON_ID=225041 /ORGANISM="Chlamydomonas chlamydogama, Strain SAG 11-48b" /LENGTH=231 /DNA_ID=CAMNT_0049601821 /DNA_START=84 /DNA_END=776 /DNA_ORIENTATION=-